MEGKLISPKVWREKKHANLVLQREQFDEPTRLGNRELGCRGGGMWRGGILKQQPKDKLMYIYVVFLLLIWVAWREVFVPRNVEIINNYIFVGSSWHNVIKIIIKLLKQNSCHMWLNKSLIFDWQYYNNSITKNLHNIKNLMKDLLFLNIYVFSDLNPNIENWKKV